MPLNTPDLRFGVSGGPLNVPVSSLSQLSPAPVSVAVPRIDTPLVDRVSGLVNPEWYRTIESLHLRTGGNKDAVHAAGVAVENKADAASVIQALAGKADTTQVAEATQATREAIAQQGVDLSRNLGAKADATLVAQALNQKVDVTRSVNAGNGLAGGGHIGADVTLSIKAQSWTLATFSPYAVVTISPTYSQVEVQALSTALADAGRRIAALEAVLVAMGAIPT